MQEFISGLCDSPAKPAASTPSLWQTHEVAFGPRTVNPPLRLEVPGMVLRPLVGDDADLDFEAVIESRDFLRVWEQEDWPSDDFTVEDNREDLERHWSHFESGQGFTYTVMNPAETECLGCVYVYPPEVSWWDRCDKTALADDAWSDVDATLQFWIRSSRLDQRLDRELLDALRAWIADAWPFENLVFTTCQELHQQVELLESAGLSRRFSLVEGDKAPFLAFA